MILFLVLDADTNNAVSIGVLLLIQLLVFLGVDLIAEHSHWYFLMFGTFSELCNCVGFFVCGFVGGLVCDSLVVLCVCYFFVLSLLCFSVPFSHVLQFLGPFICILLFVFLFFLFSFFFPSFPFLPFFLSSPLSSLLFLFCVHLIYCFVFFFVSLVCFCCFVCFPP